MLIAADPASSALLRYRVKLAGEVTLKWSSSFPNVLNLNTTLQVSPEAKGRFEPDKAFASIAMRLPEKRQLVAQHSLAELLLRAYYRRLQEEAGRRGWAPVELKK